MDTVQRLIAAAVLALAGTAAHAGYAQAKPPPGFQPMPAAGPVTGWGYAKGANESFVNGTVRTTTSLNVGGRTITMPAAMRFASNAPRFAAAALYANPYLRFGLAAAAWLGAAKFVYDNGWKKVIEAEDDDFPTDKVYWTVLDIGSNGSPTTFYPSAAAACSNLVSALGSPTDTSGAKTSYSLTNATTGTCYVKATRVAIDGKTTESTSTYSVNSKTMPCPTGSIPTPAGCIVKTPQQVPLTEEEFTRDLPSKPMPPELPNELPNGTPIPVELPVINPAPGPLPETRPAPRPYFDPSGDPVPNPNYNPQAEPSPTNQPYIQPGTKIQPSPTPSEPWRVDVQPVQRPTDSEVPKTADELNPQPDPNTNPNEQPKDQPKEDQPGLCELYPDILACQKLDTPEAKDLAREEVQISISPLGGWGAEDAACPAPKTAMVMGHEVSLSWQPVCDFATGLRPLVIALAWLSAATMLIVVARRGNA